MATSTMYLTSIIGRNVGLVSDSVLIRNLAHLEEARTALREVNTSSAFEADLSREIDKIRRELLSRGYPTVGRGSSQRRANMIPPRDLAGR
ncbi:MAG: hypothetical protein ACOCSK_02085 [Rhodothermales bacterium]